MAEILSIEWKPFPGEVSISKENSYVFKIEIDQHYPLIKHNYAKILSEDELNKSSRFFNEKDSERNILSRYMLRCILSKFLLTPPSSIQFHQLPNRKPSVDGIEFNVTHSGNLILIAVSLSPVGIDVELINETFNFEDLLPGSFSHEERDFIDSRPHRLFNFYKLWTRKEAILKASGEGLTDHLNQLDCLEEYVTRQRIKYQLKSFLVEKDYVMSLAIKTAEHELKYFTFS